MEEFCHLLNIYGINDVRQTEVHTAEPLVLELVLLRFKLLLKRYESPSIIKIPEKQIKMGHNTLNSEIHGLTNFIWNKEELP